MRWIPKAPPKYEEAPLEKLSLKALLQITQKLAELENTHKDYENVKKPLYEMKRAAYVAALNKEVQELDAKAAPLSNRSQLLWQKINPQCIGWVGTMKHSGSMLGLLGQYAIEKGKAFFAPNDTSIYYERRKFRECVGSEIEEHKTLSQKLTEISNKRRALQAQISKPKIGPPPRPPARSFLIKDQLKSFTVDADRIDRTLLMSILEEKKATTLQHQAVHQNFKAKARAYDDRQREYAKSVRNKIKRQLHEYPNCPYCGLPLLITEAHADHIYPVADGGLSTIKNMVFVCEDCNQKKKTRTLREFIKEFGLDEEFVIENLERLKKKF